MQDLAGKAAVVTGSGIGAARAHAFAALGMDVVVADVEIAGAERIVSDLCAAGGRALAERTYRELGGCAVLCNNAGVIMVGSLEDRTAKDWEWVLGVNLWGVIHGLLAFLPRMLA